MMTSSRQLSLFIFSVSLLSATTTIGVANLRAVPYLVSDGVDHLHGPHPDPGSPSLLRLNTLGSSFSSSTCDETYGFLPCTATWIGNLFLILVYGYIMYTSATFLSNGSEMLLKILGPGIIGGLFLPVLGALPDALLILVSGLSGDTEAAQSQVSVGMGLLAGSTVMLLTVIWGTSVVVGKCDLDNSVANDELDTKGWNLAESGVSVDLWTKYAARIMVVSVIPFIVVQVPQVLKSASGRRLAILIGLILSLLLLASYCLYQIIQPWIQKRKLEYVKNKKIVLSFLRMLKTKQLGELLTADGKLDVQVAQKIFYELDTDGDEHLSANELRAFVIGIRLMELKVSVDDVVNKVMKDFDSGPNPDSQISFDEFKSGLIRWINCLKGSSPQPGYDIGKHLTSLHKEAHRRHEELGIEEDKADDNVDENPKKVIFKAVLLLVLGTVMAAIFADPLVDAVDNFSDATSIPSFFISFIFLPLATNSSESVSAIIFASRKRKRTAALTFSELYGAVTMNNLLCLAVFVALVYIRGLTWDFSAEVLVIIIVCVVMGILGSFRTSFPLWTAIIAFALYPISLVLVYLLDYVLGWS